MAKPSNLLALGAGLLTLVAAGLAIYSGEHSALRASGRLPADGSNANGDR